MPWYVVKGRMNTTTLSQGHGSKALAKKWMTKHSSWLPAGATILELR